MSIDDLIARTDAASDARRIRTADEIRAGIDPAAATRAAADAIAARLDLDRWTRDGWPTIAEDLAAAATPAVLRVVAARVAGIFAPAGCGHTDQQHRDHAGQAADDRSQDRAVRELEAERDQARRAAADHRVTADYWQGMAAIVAAERDQLRHALGLARDGVELIDRALTACDTGTQPDDDGTDERDHCERLADAMERAETVRVDARDHIWRPAPDRCWQNPTYGVITEQQLDSLGGRTALLLATDGQDEQDQDAVEGDDAPSPGSAQAGAQDLGEPAGYEIVARRLHHGPRGLTAGDVVVSAVVDMPTVADALAHLTQLVGAPEPIRPADPERDATLAQIRREATQLQAAIRDGHVADRLGEPTPDHDHTTTCPANNPAKEG
ncbi:hypothetical protein [Micromonospora okii]|uniref:hypothetical protein n=1 Tax=Micromonospora okii TaxID=1182970 RepID=UPI001E2A55C7|nr:hypothetical protein [Micromonospora okii]